VESIERKKGRPVGEVRKYFCLFHKIDDSNKLEKRCG
jgi:hypothetical protein